ncbi:MAG: manganese efflux pump [Clostridia bacterium]|nr:manganese efflux pump [Clostridia bacterium]
MGIFELVLIAVGLSMDATAVALCKGLSRRRSDVRQGLIIALYFGIFQAFMPLIGWFFGKQFERYIQSFDHWIAFFLLLFVGGKMIFEVIRKDSHKENQEVSCRPHELLILAVATSIDALAVGVTFAFLQVPIFQSVLLIGLTTSVLSLSGYLLGNRLGLRFGSAAELIGGLILVLLGTKILIEHLIPT